MAKFEKYGENDRKNNISNGPRDGSREKSVFTLKKTSNACRNKRSAIFALHMECRQTDSSLMMTHVVLYGNIVRI